MNSNWQKTKCTVASRRDGGYKHFLFIEFYFCNDGCNDNCKDLWLCFLNCSQKTGIIQLSLLRILESASVLPAIQLLLYTLHISILHPSCRRYTSRKITVLSLFSCLITSFHLRFSFSPPIFIEMFIQRHQDDQRSDF